MADLETEEAFIGYWNRPDADAKALRGGWYHTGDTGYIDMDGDLFVTGRVDDMIISGGENVSPVEIESVLSLHPNVSEVSVVGLPDPRWGQKITAFVVAKGAMDAEALDHHCRDSSLANFKRRENLCSSNKFPSPRSGRSCADYWLPANTNTRPLQHHNGGADFG